MSAAFMTLRDHAKARGIRFTIDRKTFARFVSKNQYIDKRGLGAACLTIDRIDNSKGYIPGNIQPLTRSANSEKRAKQDMHRMRHGMSWAA